MSESHGPGAGQSEILFRPWVEYDSDSPEFLRGAEIGYLEAKLELVLDAEVREVMRRSNEQMVLRVARAAGRSCTTATLDDEWISVTVAPLPHTAQPAAD